MPDLGNTLRRLPERHRAALRWFAARAGEEGPWPGSLPDGTLLASKAKGIYKPRWTTYALSVRQSLGGSYSDRDPEQGPNGTWSCDYFQEDADPKQRDTQYTDVGLVQCKEDDVPVGVFRQVTQRPSARYQVLGVARVTAWDAGYLHLEGLPAETLVSGRQTQAEVDALIEQQEAAVFGSESYPESPQDGRDRVAASVVRRRGQPEFRRALLDAYGGRCAISVCDAEVALEACHIRPYRGLQTNSVSNGLLLRADLHTLLDLGLLAVDTASMTVLIAPELEGTTYGDLAGKRVAARGGIPNGAHTDALDWHRGWAEIAVRSELQ